MVFPKRAIATAVFMATTGLLASCGSGGSSTGVVSDTTTASTFNGRITGFGSVIVNGVHFDVDAANIMRDGVAITESDLKVGMIIKLSGNVGADGVNGEATEIEFDEEVKGPIDTIDVAANSFVVLGQTVVVNDETVFHGVTFDALVAGNVVEISGYFDANGAVHASLVELKAVAMAEGDDIEVKGVISALDPVNQTFMLKGLTVDYATAELDDVPDNTLSDGMFVEVKSRQAVSGGILIAEEVEYEDKTKDHAEGKELELEGLVTGVTSATEFAVNGQSVLLLDTTEFEHGSAAQITLNSKIEVKGELNAAGALVAEKVKLRRRGDLRIESTVDAVNADAKSFTMMGVNVTTTASTVWKDDSDVGERYFNLGHLSSGNRLEVRGYKDADGNFIATIVERDDNDPEEEHSIRGPLASFDTSAMIVLGVSVSYDGATEFELGSEVTSDIFFAGVVAGDIVTVEGMMIGTNQLMASSVERAGDDGRNEYGGDSSDDSDSETTDSADDTTL